MNIIVAAAVNEADTLAQCLARSPDIVAGRLQLRTYSDYPSAGAAYNAALDASAGADIIIFVHQDVYLPAGALDTLEAQLAALSRRAPAWAIAGVIGGTAARHLIGETWCSGHQRLLGARIAEPVEVVTLDELLLIVRVASGLRFDPQLPGFHLYGADAILTAQASGHSAWVIDLPVVHHSCPEISLGGGYLSAYRYMQRKWRKALPVYNLVCPLERSLWRYALTEARLRWKHRHLPIRPRPVGDPVLIARQIGYEPSNGLCART